MKYPTWRETNKMLKAANMFQAVLLNKKKRIGDGTQENNWKKHVKKG